MCDSKEMADALNRRLHDEEAVDADAPTCEISTQRALDAIT